MPIVEILFLVGLVIFITHTLEAVTGFGCTVLAFPFVIALIGDLERAKIILSILAWVLALYFVVTKFRHIQWKQFGIIVLLAGLGMPVGMLLFKSFDANTLKKVLGVFIAISATIQLYKIFVPASETRSLSKLSGFTYLLAGGIVHGAFAVGGPLIVLYTAHKIPEKGQFRATMCLLWTTLNTILIFQYFLEKKLTLSIGREILFLLPFLVAGIFAGEAIHKKVSEILFKKIVFASLLLIGVIMII
jgi:uncharacterized membrane protein YfcA